MEKLQNINSYWWQTEQIISYEMNLSWWMWLILTDFELYDSTKSSTINYSLSAQHLFHVNIIYHYYYPYFKHLHSLLHKSLQIWNSHVKLQPFRALSIGQTIWHWECPYPDLDMTLLYSLPSLLQHCLGTFGILIDCPCISYVQRREPVLASLIAVVE